MKDVTTRCTNYGYFFVKRSGNPVSSQLLLQLQLQFGVMVRFVRVRFRYMKKLVKFEYRKMRTVASLSGSGVKYQQENHPSARVTMGPATTASSVPAAADAMNGQKETSPAVKPRDHSIQASRNVLGNGDLNSAQPPQDQDIVIVFDENVDYIDLCDSDAEDNQKQEKENLSGSRAPEVDPRLIEEPESLEAKILQKYISSHKDISAKISFSKPTPKRFQKYKCICGKFSYSETECTPYADYSEASIPDRYLKNGKISPAFKKKMEEFRSRQERNLKRTQFPFYNDTLHDALFHYNQTSRDWYCARCGYNCLSDLKMTRHKKSQSQCDEMLNYMTSCYVRL